LREELACAGEGESYTGGGALPSARSRTGILPGAGADWRLSDALRLGGEREPAAAQEPDHLDAHGPHQGGLARVQFGAVEDFTPGPQYVVGLPGLEELDGPERPPPVRE